MILILSWEWDWVQSLGQAEPRVRLNGSCLERPRATRKGIQVHHYTVESRSVEFLVQIIRLGLHEMFRNWTHPCNWPRSRQMFLATPLVSPPGHPHLYQGKKDHLTSNRLKAEVYKKGEFRIFVI